MVENMIDVPLESIVREQELQPREVLWDDVHSEEGMVHSIKADGLIAPPVVEMISEDPLKVMLLSGHRRIAAIEKMGKKEVSCVVKGKMTPEERLAFVIRNDLCQKEFSSDDKTRIWKKHYDEIHKKNCDCDFSSDQKCKYTVAKWAREMGIPKQTASDHIASPAAGLAKPVNEKNLESADPAKKRATRSELGKPNKMGKYQLNIGGLSKEDKLKIVKAANQRKLKVKNFIMNRINLSKCPHCGKPVDEGEDKE